MALGDFVKPPECPTCAVYRDWLNEEKLKRAHYELLYLDLLRGANKVEHREEINTDEFKSISRITTLSSLRNRAYAHRKEINDQPTAEIAEAERVFEESINGQEKANEVRQG